MGIFARAGECIKRGRVFQHAGRPAAPDSVRIYWPAQQSPGPDTRSLIQLRLPGQNSRQGIFFKNLFFFYSFKNDHLRFVQMKPFHPVCTTY